VKARRWTIRGLRQSDDRGNGIGVLERAEQSESFRRYGEVVRVREDCVTDDDVERIRAWLLVTPHLPVGSLDAFDEAAVRDMLSMVLGEGSAVKLEDCKTPEDLEKLDRDEYVRLATTPVNQLELLRARLEILEMLQAFGENISAAMKDRT
jgi:hypothetical protein